MMSGMSDPGARTETLHSSPRAAAPAELGAGQRLGRFVIERTLGAGGMGTVVAARDPDLDRLVAIKILHAGTEDRARQQRLVQEARAIARIRHPNVVVVHEIGEHEQRLFVVMELIEGASLRDWLATGPSSEEKLAVLAAAARGLAHAHAHGITHRDFKPENVMIDAEGHAKVVDFGIAELDSELREATVAASGVTQSGEAIGTPPYMAPEQLRGEAVSPACDQFSWCVTLYEAFVGQRPERGPSLAAIAAGAPPTTIDVPAILPARVRAVLVRGLAAAASERFASMDALLRELEPPARRRWPLAVAGGLAVGVAITASVAALRGGADPCATGGARMAGAWGVPQRAALAGLGGFAPRVASALDDRAATWTASYGAVCTSAASPARTQRMTCLDDALASTRAFVRFWSAPPAGAEPSRVIGSVAALADPRACETVEPTPDAPARTPLEDALYARLAEASVARSANAWERSVEIAHAVADDAIAVHSDRVLAKARIISGDALGFLLKLEDGERELREAVDAAARSKEDLLAAHAWGTLIVHIGVHEHEPAKALILAPAARAAVARLGGTNREAELRLHLDLARVMFQAGDVAGARAEGEQAVAIVDAPPRVSDKLVGEAHFELAVALLELREREQATKHLERALEAQQRAYGADHPAVAQTLQHLGLAKSDGGDHAAALALLDRARTAYEASIGAAHPLYASTLEDIATVQRRLGRFAEAEANMQREVDTLLAAYGPAHPLTVGARARFGALVRERDVPRAITLLEEAAASAAPAETVEAQLELARAYAVANRTADARTTLDRAKRLATDDAELVAEIDAELAKLAR